ncbi:M13 family metallopeptidase [Butyrivibrio sp. INlla21]|uniref:M13 family metallopeptidase n=1 Tax=Butyrivibrio sp. INlla21 TaxID=1520811 RepID=UPI0008F04BCB|nr:M13 family metallopeptidase [Butyrivibrio sp. INlla21]SFV01520.1 putative endopeptidase [Butyrivibrio sp. INlla21]
MKKKIVSLLLSTCIMSIAITGCSAHGEFGPSDTDSSVQADEQSSDTAVQEASAAQEGTDDAGKGTGGTPWIDSDIKENVTADTKTDPKDDFCLYVNKDWILENNIPDGYSEWSHYAERSLEVKKQCMELLKDASLKGHDAELVQTFNKLVLDWDSRNKLGVSELTDKYNKIAEAQSIDDITGLITDKDNVNEYYDFVNYSAFPGLNDSKKYIVWIENPGVILKDSAEYANRTELGDMYYGYNKDLFTYMAQKFGMTEDAAGKCFDKAINLETKLATKIYTSNDQYSADFYEKINNEMSLNDAVSKMKNFPLKDILTNTGYVYGGAYLNTNPDYLALLDEVYTQENVEDIKALLTVKFVLEYSNITDKDTYDKANELKNTYFGTTGALSDEEMAYKFVKEELPDSMQMVYIDKYGSEEERQKMTELCKEVIGTYRELLSENEWASDEVKNYAIEKLDKISINAAYPDKFNDTNGINIDGCTLIEANERITLNKINENKKLMGTKVDKEKWAQDMSVTDCNAFYNPLDNSINMIIGMMGEPFYSSDMSTEELYASIGAFWVGHEVSHAFDRDGSQFDAEGYLKDWWTEEDKKEFQKRLDKMDSYLDTIVAFGDNHFVGSNIDGEMAADITGLQCALRMASKVEGFDYKKFFTKYAQMNANMSTYSSELNTLTQDPHPLDYSRCNIPVQQFEEFYEAFDVKEGDNMYLAPEDRIIVW